MLSSIFSPGSSTGGVWWLGWRRAGEAVDEAGQGGGGRGGMDRRGVDRRGTIGMLAGILSWCKERRNGKKRGKF